MKCEQIIKALEYCSTDIRENTCPKCAFYKKYRCSILMLNAVSDLINRQKAEIEELRERISYLEKSIDCSRKEYNRLLQKLQQAKSEAIKEFIKEFVERVKETSIGLEIGDDKKFKVTVVSTVAIDSIAKEMTEVQE